MTDRYGINPFLWAVLRAISYTAAIGVLLLPPAPEKDPRPRGAGAGADLHQTQVGFSPRPDSIAPPQTVDVELVKRSTSTPFAIVAGDSLSSTTRGGGLELAAMHPGWIIDGVPGRKVCTAPTLLPALYAAHGIPEVTVVALGQNDCPGWEKADYRALVDLIPDHKWMVFVTPYRDPVWPGTELTNWTEDQWAIKVERQTQYAGWMRSIAYHQPNVVTAEWRTAVATCRNAAVYPDCLPRLLDGSHPDEPSKQVWANIIHASVRDRA